jgi:hypothetical protein
MWWKALQLAIFLIVGCWLSLHPTEPQNGYADAVIAFLVSAFVTVGLAKIIDLWRYGWRRRVGPPPIPGERWESSSN